MIKRVKRAVIVHTWAAILLALTISPLFTIGAFFVDWDIHTWFMAYFHEVWTRTGNFPTLINTTQWIGNPVPLYYGTIFYPILALSAVIIPLDYVIPTWCALSLLVPYLTWHRFLKSYLLNKTASELSIIFSLSVYQLTNLYTRGAVAEFFAMQCMTAFIPCALIAMIETAKPTRWQFGLAATVLTTLALGAHPPTVINVALLSLMCLPLLCFLPGALGQILRNWRAFVAGGLCLALSLIGWLSAIATGTADLQIGAGIPHDAIAKIGGVSGASGLIYFPFDDMFYRLFPYPIDPRVAARALGNTDLISTPFLTAPINFAGLIVLVVVFVRRALQPKNTRRGNLRFVAFTIAFALCFLYLLLLSSVPTTPFPLSLEAPVQFAYRLVNTINLWLGLGLALFLFDRGPSTSPFRLPSLYIGLCLGMLALVVGGKIHEVDIEFGKQGVLALSAAELNDSIQPKNVQVAIGTIYSVTSYTNVNIHPTWTETPETQKIALLPDAKLKTASVEFSANCLQPSCVVVTNVMSSRFIALQLDGATATELYATPDGYLAVEMSKGKHVLVASPRIPPAITFSRRIAIVTTGILILAWVASCFYGLWTGLRRGSRTMATESCPATPIS